VNIALIDDKQPVLGVIYAPVLDKLWHSVRLPHCTSRTERPFTVLVSRSHRTPEVDVYINKVLRPAHPDLVIDSQGSSLKFARLVEGSADIYVCYSKTKEWDTAAADAILRAAGGRVLRISDGLPLEYSKEDYPNPPFVAISGIC
jgi:3'(2'), 5'-bisphosphate nucleotidase